MISFLFSLLVLVSNGAQAGVVPRLAEQLPKNRGCESLLRYYPANERVERMSSTQAADELISLLSLQHPLVGLYLSETDLHGDIRLLSLLWGDQQVFDLRRSAFWGKRSPFEMFLGRLRLWRFRNFSSRVDLVTELLAPISAIEWNIDYHISRPTTLYVSNHRSEVAFKTDRLFWMADFPRHWDVNDGFNVSLRLHETIHALRMRIRNDPYMAARLKLKMAEGLPGILKPTKRFLKKYVSYLNGLPADGGMNALVKKIRGSESKWVRRPIVKND